MLVMLTSANQDRYAPQVREIYWEYLQWANARINAEYGLNFEIEAMLARDMQTLEKFMPLTGRLLLAFAGDRPAGIACLKRLAPGIGQIQRMYVRPADRGRGLGRALLDRLLAEATEIGYERLYLDSARFMTEAHRMYRAAGFGEIEPYAGSEIPEAYQKNWIFMEIELRGGKDRAPRRMG